MNARNWLVFCVSVAASILAGCSQGIPKAPYLTPPDLIDQLANADLSPAAPARATGSIEGRDRPPSAETRAEMYPGSGSAPTQRKAIAGVTEARDGHYELNFADAELSELAKVIFRDTLNKPYVFDARVQGRVTISTGGPVGRNELLAVFEAVLQMNRAALISDGTLYRIVPDSERSTQNVSIFDYKRESSEIGPGYGVTIMVLNYVSSETMMTMLEQLSSGQDALRASVYNNLLIVRGTAAERQSLLELAATFDVNWMKNQSAAIFTLANAAPDEVINELQQVFKAEEQGKGLIRFKPIARLNAILALSDKAALLRDAGTWVRRLDRGGAEAEGYYVYRVENGRAKDLAALLTASFSGGSGPSTERPAEESEVAPTLAAARTASSGFNNASGGLNGDSATSTSPGEKRSGFATDGLLASSRHDGGDNTSEANATLPAGNDASGIRITADERNNTLLIKASGRKYREILGVLRKVDRPPMQVLINATLAEVTLNDNLEYGVQFFLQKNKGLDGAIGFTNGQSIDIAPAAPGLNFIVGAIASNPKIILDALAKETAVRVVSSPSVVVLHNQPATLQVGDQVPVSTKSATSLQASDPVVVNEIEFKNTGVILNVTPRINSNGLVTMEVEQEISSVARSVSSDTLTPTISQRRITSTIAVQSGQMVVLGGLISELADQQKSRVPVIDKIPYLGDVLGGNTQRGRSRTELVVFLRPSVIRNPGDASNVAEAVRASMQSLAPQPAAWDMNVKQVK